MDVESEVKWLRVLLQIWREDALIERMQASA